jgi:hypothetical protein
MYRFSLFIAYIYNVSSLIVLDSCKGDKGCQNSVDNEVKWIKYKIVGNRAICWAG